MKREIKFRAWDKDDNRMITHEQDFIPVKVSSIGVLKLDPNVEYESWYIVQPLDRFILMQFTGLHDKNGKEIYEGDVLRKEYESSVRVFEVAWSKERMAFVNLDGYNELLFHTPLELCEVIGNIYESPELLNPHP